MSAPDQRVPELSGGVDIRTLPLTAIDGFVLSRIDGRSSCAEIIAMTGLAAEQVLGILENLAALGAIRLPGKLPSPPPTVAASGVPSSSIPPPSLPPRSGPPRTPYPRASSPAGASSQPPRRRPPSGMSPRKLFSESSISGPPPPDPRTLATRARTSTPAHPRTPVPEPMTRGSTPTPNGPVSVSLPPLSIPPGQSMLSGPPVTHLPFGPDSEPARHAPSDASTTTPSLGPPTSSLMPPEVTLRSERPLYAETELDEEVELPRERRKQVLDLFYRLGTLDYYKLLGIAYGAEKKEIRSAYFSLSKAFHPDSMFRKELGSFKAKMTKVFEALTEAYDTLSKKKAREEYDAYLRSTRSVQDAERALATDDVARADTNVEVPLPPLLPVTDYALPAPTPVPLPPREVSPEARRIARELIERRLRGLPQRPPSEQVKRDAGGSVMPSQRPSVPTPLSIPPNSPPDRQAIVRQLGRTLIDVGRVTGSSDKVARAVSGARAAFERGDVAASVQHMARAFSMAPERADLHQEYERLSRMLAQKLAHDYEEQAKFEAKQGKWAAAAVSWLKVCEGRPDDSPAHRAAAYALLKAGGDLRGAQKHAQQAVYLAPDDIDARILLAQTYLTVGLRLNAKRELDAAAKLDPANEMVKNLLTDLKG